MRGFESVGRSVGGGLAEAAGQAPACARGDTIFASDKGPAYFAEAAAREISFRRAAGRLLVDCEWPATEAAAAAIRSAQKAQR